TIKNKTGFLGVSFKQLLKLNKFGLCTDDSRATSTVAHPACGWCPPSLTSSPSTT
ncbi:hypothetical protein P7K49_028965, partial [Saguinus oedipus]